MFFVGSSELRDQCEKEIDTLTSRYIDLEQEVRAQVSYHAIWFSDLADLWVIKIKSLWSFARVVHRDHVNRARKANHVARACERFVHFIVKITSLYDYQTWRRHFMRNSRDAQRYVGFFSWLCFMALIGWASKLPSRDNQLKFVRFNNFTRDSVALPCVFFFREKCAQCQ